MAENRSSAALSGIAVKLKALENYYGTTRGHLGKSVKGVVELRLASYRVQHAPRNGIRLYCRSYLSLNGKARGKCDRREHPWYLGSIPVSIWVMKIVLEKRFRGFTIALVKEPETGA